MRRGGLCYDLGCSTGTLTLRLAERLAARDARVTGVDREPDMVARAKQRVGTRADVVVGELETIELEPGGALILFEKVLAKTGREQVVYDELYREWKVAQGFDQDEITSKAQSLRGVLVPQTSDANRAMLLTAGFDQVEPVFRWLGWEGVVARV